MILNANNVHSVFKLNKTSTYRSSHPEGFLGKGALKICSKFTGEHTRQSVILIKLLCNFIEITFWHWYSPLNLLHIFSTLFFKNMSGRLLLHIFRAKLSKGPSSCVRSGKSSFTIKYCHRIFGLVMLEFLVASLL